ncbi:MAG: hypothetical protein K6E64_03800 [Lachnospiraceae bacterium]|nr:hypothetical protein [Lachnospiraceae bacterium]
MGTVVDINSNFRFAPRCAKVLDESTGEIKQRIFIALKDKKRNLYIYSPLTSMVSFAKGKKDSTQYKYMTILCHLFNYVYFEKRMINEISELDSAMVSDFLNDFSRTHGRQDSSDHKNIIIKSIFHTVTCYPDVLKNISKSDFIVSGKHIIWSDVDTTVLLPSASKDQKRKQNKTTDLEFSEVVRLLEIMLNRFPNCAFGFYLCCFGGLRVSEVTHVTAEDIPIISAEAKAFTLRISDKILSLNSRGADIKQSKVNRPQNVYILPELFEPLYKVYRSTITSGPIILNRYGNPMTTRGFLKNFTVCKQQLIEELKESNPYRAYELEHTTWGTHIGRGVFSNLHKKYSNQPYILATARGDKSFISSMPYLVNDEETITNIQNIMENMYRDLPRKNKNEKDT